VSSLRPVERDGLRHMKHMKHIEHGACALGPYETYRARSMRTKDHMKHMKHIENEHAH